MCALNWLRADAVFPSLAIDTFDGLIKEGRMKGFTLDEAESRYIEAITDGILKIMSKMGYLRCKVTVVPRFLKQSVLVMM